MTKLKLRFMKMVLEYITGTSANFRLIDDCNDLMHEIDDKLQELS